MAAFILIFILLIAFLDTEMCADLFDSKSHKE